MFHDIGELTHAFVVNWHMDQGLGQSALASCPCLELARVVGWGILVCCHMASHLEAGLPKILAWHSLSTEKRRTEAARSLEV